MEKRDIEDLRSRVACAAVLETAGFTVDLKESTPRAVKHRRGDEIIIVIHEGKGWFDPLSDAKGDVFSLIMHLERIEFADALIWIAALVGFTPSEPAWQRPLRAIEPASPLSERWQARRKAWPGSMSWRYLTNERRLPKAIIHAAVRQECLREGPRGSMWAAHVADDGTVTGWEERGPDWRGFSTGGTKTLFRLGDVDALRFCVTEAAIDAMSLAAIEGPREGSLYLSTGGGWSPTTEAAIRTLAARDNAQLVAATDANAQGEAFASRLHEIAEAAGCDWHRLKPPAEDWNEVLKEKANGQATRRAGGDVIGRTLANHIKGDG